MRRLGVPLLFSLLALSLSGCKLGPDYERPELELPEEPLVFDEPRFCAVAVPPRASAARMARMREEVVMWGALQVVKVTHRLGGATV